MGGVCSHVINRGNGGAVVFHDDADYAAFLRLIDEACARLPMRLLGYALMPNHFHLVLWPKGDGDLSRWMQWLMTAHVRRHHRGHGTSGHLWQGRFKSFPIQRDAHLLTVLRYVEQNPLRPGLVAHAQDWPWSSLVGRRRSGRKPVVTDSPVPLPRDWRAQVNRPLSPAELERLRQSVNREAPFGTETWALRTAKRLGLESSLRPRGRPRKSPSRRRAGV